MDKKITIYDLAKELKVSPSTVSRSLNDHPSISLKTKERIVKRAKELGYKMNRFAVSFSTQRSNTIGVIVPNLNSNFMSTVLSGIEKITSEAGYNLIISQSFESVEKERINAKTLFESGVDALMVSLAFDTKKYDHFEPFEQNNIPLLFFDRVHEMKNSSTIIIDNERAGFEATQHLISNGCKNLLHISGPLNRSVYANRLNGFKKALLTNQLEYEDSMVLETDLNPKKIENLILYLNQLKRPIDGIFVANDNYAAHCIKILIKNNYRIPDRIKIIGFNNDPISEFVHPTLSTVNYPGFDMGVLAGESIIGHLKGNINLKSANSISLRHELIIRESTT